MEVRTRINRMTQKNRNNFSNLYNPEIIKDTYFLQGLFCLRTLSASASKITDYVMNYVKCIKTVLVQESKKLNRIFY